MPLTLDDFQRVSDRVPLLADLKPSGKYVQEDLHAVGGTPAVMKYLLERGFLHGDCMTVTGKTLAENLARRGRRSTPGQDDHPADRERRCCRAATSASCAATSRRTGRWRRSPARKASASTARRKVFDSEEDMLAGLERGEIAQGRMSSSSATKGRRAGRACRRC